MTRIRIALISLVLILPACSGSESGAETEKCTSTTSCKLGEVCNAATGACVAEPESGLIGSYECSFEGAGVGKSEVVGTFAGTRYPLFNAVTCKLTAKVAIVTVVGLSAQGQELGSFTATVNLGRITPGAAIELFDNTATNPLAVIDSGTLWKGQGEVIAVVQSGSVSYSALPSAGVSVSGFVNVALRAP